MRKYSLKKAVIIPSIIAIGITANSGPLLVNASSGVNQQNVENTSSGTQLEILSGTDQNWTKAKVTSNDGIIEYIEREVLGDKVNIKIYSDTHELTGQVVSDKEIITVNGEVVKNADGIVNSSYTTKNNTGIGTQAVENPGDGLYLISTTNSSFQANFNTVAICISFLSVLFSVAGSWFTTAATAIVAEKIPTVWYTERKYSDKAPYKPKIVKYVTYYKNSARTKILSVSNGIY